MRTTISIEDSLLEQARKVSLLRSCTLGEVIEDSLRETLSVQAKTARKAPGKPIKTYGGAGLQPGIDLSSAASLLESMEGR
jgi:hypothetical protein